MKMPHNGTTPSTWNRYFTYTYTIPAGYTLTQTRIEGTIAADGSNVQNKVFAGIEYSTGGSYLYGGAIFNRQSLPLVDIIADFIGNHDIATLNSIDAYGGAIYNYNGTIGNITGDFIGNSASSNYSLQDYSSIAVGGAIYNLAKIGNITGDFIGNTASDSAWGPSHGGAIGNRSKIGNITGDFIGNSAYSSGGLDA